MMLQTVLSAPRMVPLMVWLVGALAASRTTLADSTAPQPDAIYWDGKIVTVDDRFRVVEALAIRGERVVAVGATEEIRALAGDGTRLVDLEGKMVLPGLIDSHVHPGGASLYEFDHVVPEMESIADVLEYIQNRTKALKKGEWIYVSQVFITRLKEQRFPSREELDRVAPHHPVIFRTGPDCALNSLALKLSGIDRDTTITDGKPGRIEKDPVTGEPTGILRSCQRLVRYEAPKSLRQPSLEDRVTRLRMLLRDYNAVGLTSIADRSANDGVIRLYEILRDRDELTCRVFLSYHVNAQQPLGEIRRRIARAAEHPLHAYDNRLWLRGIKVFLDGGMLTGSAYMRKPWGVSDIYSIRDPDYRGVLFIQPEKLYQIAKWSLERDLQITAHSVGDGAVHALIDAYEAVDRESSIRGKRPCITHGNFMSAEAIEKMKRLGIVADLQPAWLYLDGATLRKQFGEERLRYFQPYRSLFEAGVIVGGGSDHMQKIGGMRSVNPYNPFWGMWITLKRQPRWTDQPLHPEERIRRRQALELYTIHNAYLTFEEKEKGTLEPGKLADFIVIDRDFLQCPLDDIPKIRVLETVVGGKTVYRWQKGRTP